DDVNEEWISDKTRYQVDGLTRRRLDQGDAGVGDVVLGPLGTAQADLASAQANTRNVAQNDNDGGGD
ncbi:MAG: hypothetical protein EON59_17560, partial [Alphaproteobacteria bacterium]